MTRLGIYLTNRSVNKSAISRKTGISKARLSELSTKDHARLTAFELYWIALAIGVDPREMLEELYGSLRQEFSERTADRKITADREPTYDRELAVDKEKK